MRVESAVINSKVYMPTRSAYARSPEIFVPHVEYGTALEEELFRGDLLELLTVIEVRAKDRGRDEDRVRPILGAENQDCIFGKNLILAIDHFRFERTWRPTYDNSRQRRCIFCRRRDFRTN
ncbi:hypothetical protein KM043_009817 [Ampulex compressa]|nr:hypothetical protein KM043_009817 [Ampulex compressa]